MINTLESAIQNAIGESMELLARNIERAVRQALAAEVAGSSVSLREGPVHPAKSASVVAAAPKKKRVMSAAGREHIRAALKKRWAEYYKKHGK
jgi:hypothetical protein